jgi:hypothetical protein
MFRIGVMDHPGSKAALEALAKNVDSAQARMSAGVDGIGKTAGRASSLVESLTAKLDEMQKHSANAMRGAMPPSVTHAQGYRGSVSMSMQPQVSQQQQRGTVPSGVVPSIPASTIVPDSFREQLNSVRESVTSTVGRVQEPSIPASSIVPDSVVASMRNAEEAVTSTVGRMQDSINGIDLSGMSDAMRNVFFELGDHGAEFEESISAHIDKAMASLVQSPKAQAEVLKLNYQKMMIEQSEAFVSMSADLDGYTAKHGNTMEAIGANLRKGEGNIQRYRDSAGKMAVEARTSFIEGAAQIGTMVRGMATLGLVSEENAQKFMQSYAAIQGVFDIISGGARAYNSFARGMIQAREAQTMLTKAQTVASAVETAQLAQVRAYHASLVQETVAANAAAAANGRLAASRTAAGAAATAGAVGSVASGVGDAVGGLGALGGMGRMGRMAGMAGRFGPVGLAAAAAGAGIYMGGRAITETATGSSTRSDNSIGALEARVATWAIRLTGLFEKTDSPMVKFADGVASVTESLLRAIPGNENAKGIGNEFAGLAASQAGVERGQKRLNRDAAQNDLTREINAATLESEREKERMRFRNSVDAGRSKYEAETSRFGFQDNVGDRNFERQQFNNRLRMRPVQYEGVQAMAQVAELTARSTHMRSRPNESDSQLKGETKVYTEAVSGYAKAKAELDKTLSFAGSTEKQREDAMKNAVVYQDEMLRSLSKQAQLARSSGAERLQIERDIQSAAMQAIDQQQGKLDALNERRKSAMSAFVNMDAIERSMATKALDKARAGGGGALSKTEADLLGRIGTEETNRFVDQSNEVKAKKMGFDAFDQSINMTRKQIEGTRQQLEAQLQASFDVSMKVEADTDVIVDAITSRVQQEISQMAASIERGVDEKLKDQLLEINSRRHSDNMKLRRN